MGLSVEAIIAIMALFVALIQPLCALWKYISKQNSKRGMSKIMVSVHWLTLRFFRDSTKI